MKVFAKTPYGFQQLSCISCIAYLLVVRHFILMLFSVFSAFARKMQHLQLFMLHQCQLNTVFKKKMRGALEILAIWWFAHTHTEI